MEADVEAEVAEVVEVGEGGRRGVLCAGVVGAVASTEAVLSGGEVDAAVVVEGLEVLVDSVDVVAVRAAASSGELVSVRRAVARNRCCARGRAVGGRDTGM